MKQQRDQQQVGEDDPLYDDIQDDEENSNLTNVFASEQNENSSRPIAHDSNPVRNARLAAIAR